MTIDTMRPGLPSPAAAITKKLTMRRTQDEAEAVGEPRRLREQASPPGAAGTCWRVGARRSSSGETVSQSGVARNGRSRGSRRRGEPGASCVLVGSAGASGRGAKPLPVHSLRELLSACRTATTPGTRRGPTATGAAASSGRGGALVLLVVVLVIAVIAVAAVVVLRARQGRRRHRPAAPRLGRTPRRAPARRPTVPPPKVWVASKTDPVQGLGRRRLHGRRARLGARAGPQGLQGVQAHHLLQGVHRHLPLRLLRLGQADRHA